MKALACGICFILAQLACAPAHAVKAQPGQRAGAESDVETQLLALEKQRADAIVQRDAATLRELMDRYYRHVESRGRVRSKTELLTALERGEFRFQLYETETAEVQLLPGGQSAIVAGVFRSQQKGGKLFRGRFVHVWLREPDGWKNTYHQGTEIRQAAEQSACN